MIRLGLLPLPLCFISLLCFTPIFMVSGEGAFCSQEDHHSGPTDIITEDGTMNSKYRWYQRGQKTYVPVVLDHSYTHSEHSVILGGLQEISQKTCVEFDIYDNEGEVEEKDFVYINKNTKRGCYSYIGRIGGKQEIGLPIGCISHRTAMHEMLHALGFRHEHVRHDRDQYIIVFWGNIRQGRESNFRKRSPSDLVSGPYDYESIMHYERKAFSRNGMDTIRPLKSGATIGVRQEMSYWDAQKINIVYKCGGQYSHSDSGNSLEHSPALLRYNEGFERNESSLPIAEYDDFNRDQPTPEVRNRNGNSLHFNLDEHDHDHNHNHDDDDDNHHHRPRPPQSRNPYRDGQGPPPRSPSRGHGGPPYPNRGRGGPDNELESFADDHYDNNEDHNRIHYGHNNVERREPFLRPSNQPGNEFLRYLSEPGGPGISAANNNEDNANGNLGAPFYDDFYDF